MGELEAESRDEVARAVAVAAVKARTEVDTYTEQLRDEPFWRFRRRQRLNRAVAGAKEREREAIRLMNSV
jgi:hypothetical protein